MNGEKTGTWKVNGLEVEHPLTLLHKMWPEIQEISQQYFWWLENRESHDLLCLKVARFYIPSNIKKEKTHLMEDIKRLKQDKQALEVDLEKVKKERDQAKEQTAYATGECGWDCSLLVPIMK